MRGSTDVDLSRYTRPHGRGRLAAPDVPELLRAAAVQRESVTRGLMALVLGVASVACAFEAKKVGWHMGGTRANRDSSPD